MLVQYLKAGVIIEELLDLGQKAMLRLKYSKVPVISCAKGLEL